MKGGDGSELETEGSEGRKIGFVGKGARTILYSREGLASSNGGYTRALIVVFSFIRRAKKNVTFNVGM